MRKTLGDNCRNSDVVRSECNDNGFRQKLEKL